MDIQKLVKVTLLENDSSVDMWASIYLQEK